MQRLALPLVSVVLLAACSGSPKKPPQTAEAAESEKSSTSSESAAESGPAASGGDAAPEAAGIPTTCRAKSDPCVPSNKFVQRLCADVFPGVALVMLAKGTPWTRGYITREQSAVNASGGKSSDGRLAVGEEVVVVAARKADPNGMQVTGMNGFDVLRWDGTCATVSEGEIQFTSFGELKAPSVTFRYLDEGVQDALRKDKAVDEAYQNRRKECKGATMGEVSKACEKWDKKLTDSVVAAVRGGIALPTPSKLP